MSWLHAWPDGKETRGSRRRPLERFRLSRGEGELP
jgi:hypothetical protein